MALNNLGDDLQISADALRCVQALSTANSFQLQQALEDFAGKPAEQRAIGNGLVLPFGSCVRFLDGGIGVFFAGANYVQAAALIRGWTPQSLVDDHFGKNWVYSAAVSNLLPTLDAVGIADAPWSVYAGFSGGGAACTILQNYRPPRDSHALQYLITAGSPRSCRPQPTWSYPSVRHVRLMNSEDRIPHQPPRPGEDVVGSLFLLGIGIDEAAAFVHPPGGLVLYSNGSSLAAEISVDQPSGPCFSLEEYLGRFTAPFLPGHSLDEYIRRLDLAIDRRRATGRAVRFAVGTDATEDVRLALQLDQPLPISENPGVFSERMKIMLAKLGNSDLPKPMVISPDLTAVVWQNQVIAHFKAKTTAQVFIKHWVRGLRRFTAGVDVDIAGLGGALQEWLSKAASDTSVCNPPITLV